MTENIRTGTPLDPEQNNCHTTDHSEFIKDIRREADEWAPHAATDFIAANLVNENRLAADLLELHDQTGISLDDWKSAREFVERIGNLTVLENGA